MDLDSETLDSCADGVDDFVAEDVGECDESGGEFEAARDLHDDLVGVVQPDPGGHVAVVVSDAPRQAARGVTAVPAR